MSVVISLHDVSGHKVMGEELRSSFGAGTDAEAFVVRMSKLFSKTAHDMNLVEGWSLYISHPDLPTGERRYSMAETLTMAGMALETS